MAWHILGLRMEETTLQIWRLGADILNQESHTDDNG